VAQDSCTLSDVPERAGRRTSRRSRLQAFCELTGPDGHTTMQADGATRNGYAGGGGSVLAFNPPGDGLRDALDPRLKR